MLPVARCAGRARRDRPPRKLRRSRRRARARPVRDHLHGAPPRGVARRAAVRPARAPRAADARGARARRRRPASPRGRGRARAPGPARRHRMGVRAHGRRRHDRAPLAHLAARRGVRRALHGGRRAAHAPPAHARGAGRHLGRGGRRPRGPRGRRARRAAPGRRMAHAQDRRGRDGVRGGARRTRSPPRPARSPKPSSRLTGPSIVADTSRKLPARNAGVLYGPGRAGRAGLRREARGAARGPGLSGSCRCRSRCRTSRREPWSPATPRCRATTCRSSSHGASPVRDGRSPGGSTRPCAPTGRSRRGSPMRGDACPAKASGRRPRAGATTAQSR